jgi:hypothetical protein
MKEFTVKKPHVVSGYSVHRAVAALTQGEPHIWRDNGETVTIRTSAAIDAHGSELPAVELGEMRLFNLRACVGSKVRGRHIYPLRGDHQFRKIWLAKQGLRHGFELIAVHSRSDVARVADQVGRDFVIDATDFTGILKITDAVAFQQALQLGVGGTGKAFGFSLLSI